MQVPTTSKLYRKPNIAGGIKAESVNLVESGAIAGMAGLRSAQNQEEKLQTP
jgi:hypothetical protein